jgi:hypothetical protein
MDSKQNQSELRAWKLNNDIDSTSRSSSAASTTKPSTTTSIKLNNKTESKQKVPFTLKYQLNIRKNSNDSSSSTVNSPLPIGAQSGLLADLTFDQDKGQFLWATEGYQQVNICIYIYIFFF